MGFEISFNENGLTISIGWLWFGLIVSIICFIIAFNIIRANRIKRKMVLKKITANFGFAVQMNRFQIQHHQIQN